MKKAPFQLDTSRGRIHRQARKVAVPGTDHHAWLKSPNVLLAQELQDDLSQAWDQAIAAYCEDAGKAVEDLDQDERGQAFRKWQHSDELCERIREALADALVEWEDGLVGHEDEPVAADHVVEMQDGTRVTAGDLWARTMAYEQPFDAVAMIWGAASFREKEEGNSEGGSPGTGGTEPGGPSETPSDATPDRSPDETTALPAAAPTSEAQGSPASPSTDRSAPARS